MKKIIDNVIAIFIIGIILLIVIPLNKNILDFMLIFNITLSLCILLIAMYIKESLEFSIFPSILLITTLFRVALNVSTARLILGNGGDAGNVIHTFGKFVIGGNAVVGIIIFIIIVIVQFIVITKGSERVAEVAARFTLDAMPGKQMAIDADLNSGLINDEAARIRRSKIQREADFYGAMDGASKFVKGDAIVSIIIVFINILAGSIIGMVQGGKSITEVMSIYTVATIGDGLVSQLPALLISTATGMIVTRAASENSMSYDLSRQIVTYPIVLMIVGSALLLMCFIPGLPIIPLVLLGTVLIYFGNKLSNDKKKEIDNIVPDDLPVSESNFYKNIENIYTLLSIEPIEMEFGYSLIPLIDESKGGNFIDRVVMLRRQFAVDIGMVIPSVRLRDNSGLNSNQYVIKLKGEEVVRGEVLVDHFLAMNSDDSEDIEGIDTIEPAFGISAKWIRADQRDRAHLYGYTIIDPLSVIVTHLSEVIKKHAHELLGRQEVTSLLDNIKKTNKALVDDIIPSVITIGELQKVLCNLLLEQIPIRDLETILETIGDYGSTIKDTEMLTEYVRQALKRTITRKFTEDGQLKVITLNSDLENTIMSNVKKTDQGSYFTLEPDMMQKIISVHLNEIKKSKGILSNPIILASPVVRIYYKKLIEQFAPDTIVLSFNEIEPSIHVQSIGTIELAGAHV